MSSRQAPPNESRDPSGDEASRILKARAKALARPPVEARHKGAVLDVVEFALAQERYAILTDAVREVYPLKDLTPLPCCPGFLLGIVNVRGQILPVIDIKKFFELPEQGITDLNKVIIVHGEQMDLGILADVVIGVREVPLEALEPSLPTLVGIREEYLKGITPDRLVILDAEKILSDPKIIVNEEVEA
jgi:purine-binding chemotaxis protein CheW